MAFSYKDDKNIYKNPLKLIKVTGSRIFCRCRQEKCFPPLKGTLSTKKRASCPVGIRQLIRKNRSVAVLEAVNLDLGDQTSMYRIIGYKQA